MLKKSELETLRQIYCHLVLAEHDPTFSTRTYEKPWINDLKNIILKYEQAQNKIASRTKPFPDGELYELKIVKGLSIREIINVIKKRRGVSYSRSTIENQIRVEGLVGKGKMAEKYKEMIERAKNENLDRK